MDDFRDRLRTYRASHKLTQVALARLIGVSWRTLARWETGAAKPRALAVLAALAKLGLKGL